MGLELSGADDLPKLVPLDTLPLHVSNYQYSTHTTTCVVVCVLFYVCFGDLSAGNTINQPT